MPDQTTSRPRCLVTGITGMVGSHLADYLLSNTDWEIFGFARWNEDTSNINHLIPRINDEDRIHLAALNDGSHRPARFHQSREA